MRNGVLEKYNILLAGVGGTGVITAARLLGIAAIKQKLEVRIGEIHGMAQRGGMISVQVRVGKGIFAPTFMDGEADLLVGFELTEALRNIHKLSTQGMAILNDYHIPSSLKKEANVEKHDFIEAIKGCTKKLLVIDAVDLSRQAGSTLALGTVLLGAAATVEGFPLEFETLKETIKAFFPKKYQEINDTALTLGFNYSKKKL